jgi:hypothetical protein
VLELENNQPQYKSKLAIKEVNVLYLAAMVLLITAGAFVQTQSFNSGILITEFVLIALPVFLFIIFKKGSIKHELRFNKLHLLDALLVIFIFVCGYPVAIFINLIGTIFISMFGKLIQSPIPIAENFGQYFVLLLIIAGSAGICEEILFRGLVMRGYEKLGKWKNIVFTAVLFSLLHMNVQNTLGPLFLGILLGYVVYTTNSIFAGMIGHFTNNALSVTVGYLLMQLPMAKMQSVQELAPGEMLQGLLILCIPFGILAVFAGAIVLFCLWGLKEINSDRNAKNNIGEAIDENQSLRSSLKTLRYRGLYIFHSRYLHFLLYCNLLI